MKRLLHTLDNMAKIVYYSFDDALNAMGVTGRTPIYPSLILMQDISKTRIWLSNNKWEAGSGMGGNKLVMEMPLDYGASEFIKEDLAQNVILFGVTGKNGDSVQVTGTDSKRISWNGMFYSSHAIEEKESLEAILNAGNPMSFKAFYNKQVYTVVVQSASFEIRKECYVTYSINLIEYKPIIYTAIKKDFWTQIPTDIGGNTGNPNIDEQIADLCADSIRINCAGVTDYVVDTAIYGGETNACLNTSDIFTCNLAFMADFSEKKKITVQAILNVICEYFRNYVEYGAYMVVGGIAVPLPDGLNCIMGVSTSSFSRAFEKFLTSGCYTLSLLKDKVSFVEIDSDGKLCLTAEFIESLKLFDKTNGSGMPMVYALQLPKKPAKSGEINMVEFSAECAKFCMGEKAFNELLDKSGATVPNSGAEFTVDLRYKTMPYAELSVRQNVEGKFTVAVYVESTVGGGFGSTPDVIFNLEANGASDTYTIDMTAFTRNAPYNCRVKIYKQTSVPTDDDPYRIYDKVIFYKSEID